MSFFKFDLLGTRRGRLATFFLLYVSEGIPLGFTALTLATHMRREGVDPAVIGAYVGSLYLPWAFKWAFGPIVDTITSVRFGRRRTWIVGAQIMMTLTLLMTMPIDVAHSVKLLTAVMFVHNVFAAAQDVAIDALAVQVLPPNERGTANGFMFGGQSVGQAIGGAGMLMLVQYIGFDGTFYAVALAITAILIGVSWQIREAVPTALPSRAGSVVRHIARDIGEFTRAATRAFLGSRAATVAVGFAILPLGAYALSLALSSNLAVELGLEDSELGTLSFYSSLLSATGCIVGGWLSDRFGRRRMIALFVMLTAIPTVWLALTMQKAGHIAPADVSAQTIVRDTALISAFWAATLAFNVCQGLTYGSSAALYMDVTTPAVAATQFSAYMALGNLVTTYTSTWQGFSIVTWGYPTTLMLDALFGVVCIALLPWMGLEQRPSVQPQPAVT